ncbi:MAG: GyrI-like domain-containing protein, partial [Gammaproteobacteria bacterium]|nr:GyrI-like domain-containing protein [Gammaproteobacteria bacterium]
VDYRVQGSKLADLKVVERPAEHLLVVSAGSVERNNEKIEASMKSNMEWISRTMAANGLAAAGPMRIISTELGRENYTFDVAQPVRKAGGAAAGDDAGDDAPAIATPAPAGTAALVVKPLGPVAYVQTQAGRAAAASYTGYMAELENVRNALRAWALTQGYEVVDRPYEVYNNGIDQAFTENGQYDIYWAIR